jgi:hypothetical protein
VLLGNLENKRAEENLGSLGAGGTDPLYFLLISKHNVGLGTGQEALLKDLKLRGW